MKIFTNNWNHIDQMPKVGEKIMCDFGNGMGTNRNKPYLVEIAELDIRADRKVVKIEGRQILKSGKLKNVWFELFFTNKLFKQGMA